MDKSTLTKTTLCILLFTVFITGVSQGMLMPVISILFEQRGISPTISGIHATSYYIGIILAAPFSEILIRKAGFKKVMLLGLVIICISLVSFILFKSIIVWFLLRMLIGVGGNMLNLASQTWVTSTAQPKQRGMIISIYGLSFGLGFAVGPYATNLINYNKNLPFLFLAVISLIALLLVSFLKETSITEDTINTQSSKFINRFGLVFKHAWIALLFPFSYGVLEAVLNVNLPTQLVREGLQLSMIATIISTFAIGSVVFQIPLGILSDRLSRRTILMLASFIGAISFFLSILFFKEHYLLITFLFIAGMFVGSFYSLGVAYLVDLLPKSLLPMGTMMSGLLFSFGSILGPSVGGRLIEIIHNFNVLWVFVGLLVVLFVILSTFRTPKTADL